MHTSSYQLVGIMYHIKWFNNVKVNKHQQHFFLVYNYYLHSASDGMLVYTKNVCSVCFLRSVNLWRPLQTVFAGRLQRNGCFRAASGNFVIQCRRHYKVFLQEASNETLLCKGSPVWPFIILKRKWFPLQFPAVGPEALNIAPGPKF